MVKKSTASQETATILALKVVGYLAESKDLLEVFLNSTGLDENTLRTCLEDPEFQAAILDFLMMDDTWLLGFAQAHSVQPEEILGARAALPGGDLPHWT